MYSGQGKGTIMDIRTLYSALMAEISEAERGLVEKKVVAKYLRQQIEREDDGLDLPEPSDAPTWVQRVSTAIGEIAAEHQDFTAIDVYTKILARYGDLPVKAKSKVSTIMSELATTGALVRTVTGAGSVPHRYRLKTNTPRVRIEDEESLT